MRTSAYGWSAAAEGGRGAQIDLVLARGDRTVNICEMKYTNGEFVIGADYEKELRNKVDAYQRETGTENREHVAGDSQRCISKGVLSSCKGINGGICA